MRVEFFDLHQREWATLEAAQAALDAWVVEYNTERPHRSCGGRPPAERFAIRAAEPVLAAAAAVDEQADVHAAEPARRPAGVSRWVDQTGGIRLAGNVYRVGTAFAGRQVEVVTIRGLVEILHASVLIATHVQRRPRGEGQPGVSSRAVPARTARNPTAGLSVTRIVDGGGTVSFAGTGYRVGIAWARKSVDIAVVAGSVQISAAGKIIRVHAARHDPVKEHGAFAVPGGRPRLPKPSPPLTDGPAQAAAG